MPLANHWRICFKWTNKAAKFYPRMFCTSCEIIADSLKHYKSQLHAINLKRKLAGYSPVTLEELESDTRTDEFVIDLNHHYLPPQNTCKNTPCTVVRKEPQCLFCGQRESPEHYFEHGLSREQISYIALKQCYICYEKFISKSLLFKHLEEDVHRTAATDGTSLFLQNGTILQPSKRNMGIQFVGLPTAVSKAEPVVEYEYWRFLDTKRLELLKCGIANNRSFRKKPS